MLKINRRDAGKLASLFCWYEFDIIFISHGMHGFFLYTPPSCGHIESFLLEFVFLGVLGILGASLSRFFSLATDRTRRAVSLHCGDFF